jgi:DNA-binding MarR family transcriptional regulator
MWLGRGWSSSKQPYGFNAAQGTFLLWILKSFDGLHDHRRERQFLGCCKKKLGVSPAAISQSIARLEQELEVRLFNRTTRQLTLTEDGRRFYAQCRGPVNNLDSAINQLKASRDEPAGHLRVSMPNSFGRRFILPIMGEFCERYPKVRVFLAWMTISAI